MTHTGEASGVPVLPCPLGC